MDEEAKNLWELLRQLSDGLNAAVGLSSNAQENGR